MTGGIRITGTDDAAEIAAVLVTLATRRVTAPDEPVQSPYERWRLQRTAALRGSRRR